MDGLADCEIKGSRLPLSHPLHLLPLSPSLPPCLFASPDSPPAYFFSARLLGMSRSCYGANVTVSLASPLPVSQQIHRFIDWPYDP